MSIGSFYVNEDTNTVMGPAVTDAAAWYDRSDWIGVHATPHASIVIESLVADEIAGPIANFPVPLKQGPLMLKVVNWPRAFLAMGRTRSGQDRDPRTRLLTLLGKHEVPIGTEIKYFNTIAFFDSMVKKVASRRAKKARPN